ANYHRHVVSKQTFYYVDTAIFKVLWSWAKRRHPNKPRRWVADKYFRPRHGRTWTFVGTRVDRIGKPYELTLVRAGDTPIKRHVKVKGAANPYDPQWEVYFEKRLGVEMAHQLRGRRCALARRFAASPERLAVLPHRDTNGIGNGCGERSTGLDERSSEIPCLHHRASCHLPKQSLCQKVCRDCQKDLP